MKLKAMGDKFDATPQREFEGLRNRDVRLGCQIHYMHESSSSCYSLTFALRLKHALCFPLFLFCLSHIGNSGVKNQGHDKDTVCRSLYQIGVLYQEAMNSLEINRGYFEVAKAFAYSIFVICFLI